MKEKKIYLLEDDPDIKDLISYILTKDGYEVFAFEKVRDINAQIEKELPDLFIFDVSLPDGNGLDLTQKLVSRKSYTPPVLLMSADYENQKKAIGSGASYFMRKPFDVDDLRSKVEVLLVA